MCACSCLVLAGAEARRPTTSATAAVPTLVRVVSLEFSRTARLDWLAPRRLQMRGYLTRLRPCTAPLPPLPLRTARRHEEGVRRGRMSTASPTRNPLRIPLLLRDYSGQPARWESHDSSLGAEGEADAG